MAYKFFMGKSEEVLPQLAEKSIDVVVTSPTYWNERGEQRGNYLGVETSVELYLQTLIPIFTSVKKALKDSGSMWIVLGDDPRNILTGVPILFADAMKKAGWDLNRLWYWDKQSERISSEFITEKSDCIFQFYKSRETPFETATIELDNVNFSVPKAVRWEGSNTVAYPMEMLIRMISGSSPKEGIVLDPFMGTGTTAIAALTLGRNMIGIEMGENELIIARKRMNSFEASGYVEKTWKNQPGGYRENEEGPRIQLGGNENLYERQSVFLDTPVTYKRLPVSVRGQINKLDFGTGPMWMSKNCCDDECGCVSNYGCVCKHDCHCPDKSMEFDDSATNSLSLVYNMSSSTRIKNSSDTLVKETEMYHEPRQTGEEDDVEEPGYESLHGTHVMKEAWKYTQIIEYGEQKDTHTLVKDAAADARARGLVPQSGDWKHPKHWIKPEENQVPQSHKGIRIPPAWTDVELNIHPEHRQVARGYDKAGRRQYLYTAIATDINADTKHTRVKDFTKQMPMIMAKIKGNIGTGDDNTDILYLISKTGFRVGSDKDTKAKVDAFGASTLRATHVSVSGDNTIFNFTAKKGVIQQKEIHDRLLARMMRTRLANKMDMERLFNTKPNAVLKQLRSYSNGVNYDVKDFRGHIANTTAQEWVGRLPKPINEATLKSAKKIVAEEVAKVLGNTPAVALNSYISPEIFAEWESDIDYKKVKKALDAPFDFIRDIVYNKVRRWTTQNTRSPEDTEDE